MDATLEGKYVLVTGATSGMGKVTALRLAEQGATVVLVGRNAEKTQATVREIQKRVPKSAVQSLVADLSSLAQVRALARAYRDAYPRLDVLIHNAGAMFARRELSADGLEMTFALNYFAPFLLTHLLLDTLKASVPARIITVASAQHAAARRVPFEDMTHQKGYKPLQVYGESKLMAIMFTYALARRLQGTGVTANVLHPGVVATHFGKDAGGMFPVMFAVLAPFVLSPEKGARTAIYLASSPEVADVSGQYFVKSKSARSSKASNDVAAQERLWTLSEQLTGIAAPQSTPASAL